MDVQKRVDVKGSERHLPPRCERIGDVDGNASLSVTVVLHRTGNQPAVAETAIPHATPEEFGQKLGASADDIRQVEQFASDHHLSVGEVSIAKRRVVLHGTAADLSAAFGAQLAHYRNEETNQTFRGRTGTLSVPEGLGEKVLAVLGLDNRQIAFPHFRVSKAALAAAQPAAFSPPDLATLYNFPTGLTGKGQTIGIVELGGGYRAADLTKFFKGIGIATPSVTAVSVDGGKNTPGSSADGEVELDIEVAGAVAPGAHIAVYFAPNTDQGFVDAITDAVHDAVRKPSVISISWGASEDAWTAQARNAMNAALQDAATLNVTVTVASGDNGSTDGVNDKKLHVDFPSASPFALACGGTTLKASGKKITSETVWNETAINEGATGGGVSNAFPIPSYQKSAGVPKNPQTSFAGRGVPDVAGVADPSTGYKIVVDGKNEVIGGTSAVAPLWAGLIALLNQKLGKPVGFLQPKLYALTKPVLNDITSGNNDDGKLGSYSAKAGWDPCTGLGSPNGTALLSALTTSTGAKA